MTWRCDQVSESVIAGRAEVGRLVLDLMRRTGPSAGSPHRPLPVVLLVGQPGSGRTLVLEHLRRGLDGRVPHAWLDFAGNPDITPRQVLTYLAFELNRWCADYGRLAFRRFLTGELVIRLNLSDTSRDAARASITAALEEYRHIDKLRSFLQVLAAEAARTAAVPGIEMAGRYVPGLLLDGLIRWNPARRVMLGRATQWYADPPGRPRRDARDTLVDLNRWSRGWGGDPADADTTMCAAFLADLGEQFGSGHALHRRPLYCPVLLDNVDTPAGGTFLDRLVRARTDFPGPTGAGPGPLVVVATGRRAPLGLATVAQERAGYDDWRQRHGDGERPPHGAQWWYPIALRDLTRDEVRDIVAGRVPDPRRTARFVHRLTGGHPEATVLVADVLAEHLRNTGHQGARLATDLRRVLTFPVPGHGGGATGPHLLSRLLGDVDPELLDALTTCSAARDQADAARMMVARVRRELLTDINSAAGWAVQDGHNHRVLHPLPRRLLLARLADRPEDDDDSFARTHERLRDACQEADDQVGVLHHRLAMRDVAGVVAELRLALRHEDTTHSEWLARFAAVTRAPNDLPGEESPMTQVARLTGWVDPTDLLTATLARLTVAVWIETDPLGDPLGDLHRLIANEFRTLAPFSRSGFEVFMDEAERYDRMAHSGE